MRMRLVFGMMALVWVILLARIYHISIKSNTYYEEIANQNAIKVERLAPLRGSIKDVHGRPIAVNRLGFSIGIAPHLSARSRQPLLDEEVAFLGAVLKQDPEELKRRYLRKDSPYFQGFVTVVDFISHEELIEHFSRISLRERVKIAPASKRHYPYGKLASHVIGYVGRANLDDYNEDPISRLTNHVGRTGLERFYNGALQGKEGERRTRVTAFNHEVEEISKVLPTSRDLELTLDLELQQYLSEIMGEDAGAIIVMDAHDGKLLAAGSFPEYDLNQFVTGISHDAWQELVNNLDNPFTNKLVNGLYPPGSVVKMGVGLALLGTQKINRQTSYFCTASFELGGRNFRCWKNTGHGHTDLNKAIRESCDDYFYKTSLKVGIDSITPVLERLGFGTRSGIDLPNEFMGTVPGRHWKMQRYQKPWYQGETLITSIGQGYFLATPLQVAVHTGILATGKKVIPHFVKSIDGEVVEYEAEEDVLTEIEKAELPHIQRAMYEVANHPNGTAYYRLLNSKVKVAAKTGTAQVVGIAQDIKDRVKEEDMAYFHRSHAWLTSYGPYKNPRYVVTVMIEHGGHGGQAAGPIVTKIYNKLHELGYIQDE